MVAAKEKTVKKEQKPGGNKGGKKDGKKGDKKSTLNIKVGAFPGGKIVPLEVPEGTTVEQALVLASLVAPSSSDDIDVRVNGKKQTILTAKVTEGDQILLFAKVRGN
jgi:hypothetical protein